MYSGTLVHVHIKNNAMPSILIKIKENLFTETNDLLANEIENERKCIEVDQREDASLASELTHLLAKDFIVYFNLLSTLVTFALFLRCLFSRFYFISFI